MQLTFLPSGPCLLVEGEQRVMVIADLHFGIETDYARHGVHIPSQGRRRIDRALACVREATPDLLVLLGDVKHSIPITTRQEYRELPDALDALRRLVPIRVIPGNHDGGIERFLDNGELLPAKGAVIDGVGYLHGHTAPSADLLGRLILLGHLHPVVSVRDEVGCAMRDRVYLSGVLDPRCLDMEPAATPTRILVLPAFNEFSGYDVLRKSGTALGPIARCMNYDDAEVILPDGTYLGPIRTLQPPDGA